jgi:KUP system potassium uptake protein
LIRQTLKSKLVLAALVFGTAEITYFAANLTKIVHGGWLPLLIAATVFTIMMTWQRGREIMTIRRTEMEGTLGEFVDTLPARHVTQVAGTAIYPHLAEGTAPLALRLNVEHNHVLHKHVIVVSARTADVPHIPWAQRITVDHLGDPHHGIVHVAVDFGFQDRTDIPEALRRAGIEDLDRDADIDTASYFLSRISMRRTREPGMNRARKRLFIALVHNATTQTEYLCLPEERTITVSSQINL